MKKFKVFFTVALMMGAVVAFDSCKKDDDNEKCVACKDAEGDVKEYCFNEDASDDEKLASALKFALENPTYTNCEEAK